MGFLSSCRPGGCGVGPARVAIAPQAAGVSLVRRYGGIMVPGMGISRNALDKPVSLQEDVPKYICKKI